MNQKSKKIICGLDIGASKVCATCGIIDSWQAVKILGAQTIPTQGIKDGRVSERSKVAACIREATSKLAKSCGKKISRVYVNIDSPDLRAKVYPAELNFSQNTEIKKSHIQRLVARAVAEHRLLDRKVIYAGFKNFILNQQTTTNPEGQRAEQLKLNVVLVSDLIPTVNNLIRCIKDAGLTLEDMVPSSAVQGLGLLGDSEQKVILIDVGGQLTKIALLEQRLLKGIIIIPQGAQSITEDIASGLKVSVDCAEQLKIKYGQAHVQRQPLKQKIMIKDGSATRIIQLEQLNQIVVAEVNQLLQKINQARIELTRDCPEPLKIIVSGGGAMMEGFLERAEALWQKPVRMGILSAVRDNQIQAQSAVYATSVGLIQLSQWPREKLYLASPNRWNPLLRMARRVRRLYDEYF